METKRLHNVRQKEFLTFFPASFVQLCEAFISAAQDDDDERVRGWFPRRCVKIPEHPHHHHSDEDHASSTQTNDKGDVVKSSPTSATSSPSKGKEVKDGSLKEKDKSKSSLSQGSGATGTTPTSGARKRAKKDKKKETEK